MSDQLTATAGHAKQRMMTPISLGHGFHGTLEVDPVSMVVCKRVHAYEAVEQAQREYEYLQRFSIALANEPNLRCAQPVAVDSERGKVWMTFCPGGRLDHLLINPDSGVAPHLDHLAELIAIAVERYISEFNEPYHDLATWNMLYQQSTCTLHLIDFMSARDFADLESPDTLFDISAGVLIGLSIYDTVRPRTWKNRIYWQRQQHLLSAVLQRLQVDRCLSPDLVRRVAATSYEFGANRGSRFRRFWYATVGRTLFSRRSAAVVSQIVDCTNP